jgi:hypothetical protein
MRICFGLLIALSVHAMSFGQDCGPNPEMNVQWSSNFKEATVHEACSATKAGATLLGEDFLFQGNYDANACQHDSMSDEQASQYIQAEISNKNAAIVATCGYYACKMAGTSASVPNIAALSSVCSEALHHSSGASRSANDFKLIPAFLPVVVQQPSQNIRVFLENSTNGTLTFDKPRGTDASIKVLSPSSPTFALQPHAGRWITLQIMRPTGIDLPVMSSVPVMVHNNAADQASVTFSVGKSPTDFLPPLSLRCGSIDPHMVATAYSDVQPGHGFDPKTATRDAWVPVPTGETDGFQTDGAEYHNNGGGYINIKMDASCTPLDATRQHAAVILSFTTATTAESGHCCSGFGPGADGTTNPEWKNEFSLAGNAGSNKWSFTAITSPHLAGPNPACKITMDGVEAKLDVNVQRTTNFSLDPGKHVLDISCTEGRIGSRPGAWLNTVTFNETLNVTLDAHLD